MMMIGHDDWNNLQLYFITWANWYITFCWLIYFDPSAKWMSSNDVISSLKTIAECNSNKLCWQRQWPTMTSDHATHSTNTIQHEASIAWQKYTARSHTDNSFNQTIYDTFYLYVVVFFCILFGFVLLYVNISSFHTRCYSRHRWFECMRPVCARKLRYFFLPSSSFLSVFLIHVYVFHTFLRFNSYTNWKSSQSSSFSANPFD